MQRNTRSSLPIMNKYPNNKHRGNQSTRVKGKTSELYGYWMNIKLRVYSEILYLTNIFQKYGTNWKRAVRDRKLNYLQWTVSLFTRIQHSLMGYTPYRKHNLPKNTTSGSKREINQPSTRRNSINQQGAHN